MSKIERLYRRVVAWLNGWERVSGLDPRDDILCEWCGEAAPTTINSVWSRANPEGRRVRMCRNCADGCEG